MKYAVALLCALPAFLLAGCGSPPNSAQYVDPNGPRTIVSLNQIDIQDFSNAANAMVQDLLNSGVLEKAPAQPAVLAISRITNNTTQQFDTDMLIKNIRIALLQTGKVVTTTTFGANPEDKMAQDAGNMQAFMNGQPQPTRIPYYTLSGKIDINTAQAGDVYQRSYIFQLSLTEVSSGLAVWEGQKIITKQGQKAAIGW
jgi:penicillin-binding protein activator